MKKNFILEIFKDLCHPGFVVLSENGRSNSRHRKIRNKEEEKKDL
jgi:hypothetical protein